MVLWSVNPHLRPVLSATWGGSFIAGAGMILLLILVNSAHLKPALMKLSRLLMLAAAGVAVGYLLTRTEKGNQLRRNLSDSASGLGEKLNDLRRRSGKMAEDLMDDVSAAANRLKKQTDGQAV